MAKNGNVAFVKELMEKSPNPLMAQMFILDAIGKFAERVANTPDDELIRQFGENYFVHPLAWKRTAMEINEKMKEKGM